MLESYVKLILQARVYDVARETPLDYAPKISERLNNTIWLKREDLQPVFSYKLRGAYNLMVNLSEQERKRGVIAASAGNHAQGVALSARELGIQSLIVMPRTTPDIKVEAVRRLGSNIHLHGDSYDDASEYALAHAVHTGMTYVPPFDHPLIIAGQGTVARELVNQHHGRIDAVFVPVGGGGLIAGVAVYLKYLFPHIRIIGVEPDEAPSMSVSLKAGKRVRLDSVGIFADGAAVKEVGRAPFEICKHVVDEMITVTTDEICASVRDIFESTRAVAEPAGALALAGLKQYVRHHNLEGANLIAIVSGANVNFDRLRHIAELAALGAHQEALIGVTLPERPGSFRLFCKALGNRGLTEFNYRFSPNSDARVFAGVSLKGGILEKDALIQELLAQDYPVVDLSHNNVAKQHVRYMIGGQADVPHEHLFRIEFPVRAGALLDFLTRLEDRWNISLFHYRNHGAAYGRVFMGIQLPGKAYDDFLGFLNELGLIYFEETGNPAAHLFLQRGDVVAA